jgi:hypothetical protein
VEPHLEHVLSGLGIGKRDVDSLVKSSSNGLRKGSAEVRSSSRLQNRSVKGSTSIPRSLARLRCLKLVKIGFGTLYLGHENPQLTLNRERLSSLKLSDP